MAKTKTVTKVKSQTNVSRKPPKDLRKELKDCVEDIEKAWFKISVDLSEVYYSELYKTWGFEKFGEYLESDLGLDYRTGMWRVQMGKAIIDLGITQEQLKGIEWTKFKEISLLLNENTTKKDLKKYLSMAKDMSYRDLKDFVKEERVEAVASGKVSRKVTMTFHFSDEQASVVEEALKEAGEITQSEEQSIVLEYICMEWSMTHNPDNEKEIASKLHDSVSTEKAPHKSHANKGKKSKDDLDDLFEEEIVTPGKKVTKKKATKKKVAKKKVTKKKAKK